MKILILLILISQLFSAQIIDTYSDGRTSIFIYHSGKALIHENRILEVTNPGDLELNIVDLPQDIDPTGIQISANNYNLDYFSIVMDLVTEKALLKHFVGSKIILQDYENDKSKDATLISFNKKNTIYGTEDGVVVNPDLKPIFPYIPESLEDEIYIKTSGKAELGKSVMKFSYFIDKMRWTSEYHLVINDEDKATLSGDYQIQSMTTKDFPNSEIYLVADNNQESSNNKKSMRRMALSAESKSMPASTPSEVGVEDVEIYKLPKKMSVMHGSNIHAKFLNSTQLSMERIYTASHSVNFYGRGSRQQFNDNLNPTDLSLKLNSSENIKMHLPQGRINVYENKDGLNMFIKSKTFPKTSKGNNIFVKLKSSQDILHKINQIDFVETLKGNFVTVEAEFKNLKNKPITVLWNENSNRQIDIVESSIEFSQKNPFEFTANVVVDAGQTRKETVKLFTPKRD